ncbi:MAG: fatty acid desaturase [Planctomycetota bacterium]|nr:MAG: fatty acid desaturase [Planctomycetota bacterium]REK26069.1 MAG: fatty acid desaturase [Planctomycetota bacterium]REK27057.1 MAG: fatty acid desaturase [Planctomycetota bacterium]
MTESVTDAATAQIPSSTWTTPAELRRLEISATLCLVLIWVLIICAFQGWLHPAVLLIAPLLYIRFELNAHELIHACRATDLNPIVRYMPAGQSIYHMGYEGYRRNHLDHHRFVGTKDDPERYLVDGPAWLAAIKSVGCIDVAAVRYVRLYHKSFTWRDYLEALFHVAAFVGLLLWNWRVFLVYFVSLRVMVGLADFFFHRSLHAEGDPIARWFRRIDKAYPWLFGCWLGRHMTSILVWHDAHHAYPRVSARNLPEVEQLAGQAEGATHTEPATATA